MKKKLVLCLLCGLTILSITTGCNNKENSNINFEILDSKIDYIVIKNKKIYLTRNFKDFTLQFRGLGCTVKGEYQSEKDIDSIDENDPTLIESVVTNYIKCYDTDERKWGESVNISMHTYTKYQGDINDIYYWNFSSTSALFDLHINNKTLLFGYGGRNPSTPNELIEILGNNYKEESDAFSSVNYKYKEGTNEYSFRIDKENNELEGFSLSISKLK